MTKTAQTYHRVADTFEAKADKAWAKACNGEHPANYSAARSFYQTAETARDRANEIEGRGSKGK